MRLRVPARHTKKRTVNLAILELSLLALPRRDKLALADWLDGLTRGHVGPILEDIADLQVQILCRSIEEVAALRDFVRKRLSITEPEPVGDVIVRSITAIARVLGPDRSR